MYHHSEPLCVTLSHLMQSLLHRITFSRVNRVAPTSTRRQSQQLHFRQFSCQNAFIAFKKYRSWIFLSHFTQKCTLSSERSVLMTCEFSVFIFIFYFSSEQFSIFCPFKFFFCIFVTNFRVFLTQESLTTKTTNKSVRAKRVHNHSHQRTTVIYISSLKVERTKGDEMHCSCFPHHNTSACHLPHMESRWKVCYCCCYFRWWLVCL